MITLHTPKIIASTLTILLTAGMAASTEPATDNAALLYYQACLLYGGPEQTIEQAFTDFRNGQIESTEAIRKHIESSQRVVELAVKAADLPRCDWGYDYSQGLELTLTHLSAIKRITFLLVADARLAAEQGDYRTALNRCMTIHRMGLHVSDRVAITYLMGISLSAVANKTMQDVLAGVASDLQMLNQVRTQLSQIQDAFPPMQYAITQEGQVLAESIRKEKADSVIRELALDENDPNTGPTIARILGGDEAFFERNRARWLGDIAAIVAILDSKTPYRQTHTKLDQYSSGVTDESKNDPDATFAGILLPATSRIYLLTTRLQAHFNAVKTAIDLYAIRARTGRLPDVLPADTPRDPFSGESFVYEKTDNHFTLRCREKEEPEKAEANQYEFKLRQ